VAAEIKEELRA
jgi:transposase